MNEQNSNNNKNNKMECKRCGHVWVSRKPMPLTCPRCHRYDYFGQTGEYFRTKTTE